MGFSNTPTREASPAKRGFTRDGRPGIFATAAKGTAAMILPIRIVVLALAAAGALLPGQAAAYVGPGAGLTAIGTAVAVIGAFLLLIVGFVWYPVKRLLRGRRSAGRDGDDGPPGAG